MNRLKNLILGATALLTLGACGVAPNPSPQIRFVGGVGDVVRVEPPVVERDAQNLLHVAVPITNVASENVELLVRIEFLDHKGNRYNDDTPRQVLLLPGGETRDFRASSLMSKASDFIATIRWNQ